MQCIILLCIFVISSSGFRPKFEKYSNYKKTNGFDHRPKNITESKEVDLSKIRLFFKKKLTINTLQNTNISVSEKMRIIDNTILELHSLKSANLFAGGLMGDWEFELEN